MTEPSFLTETRTAYDGMATEYAAQYCTEEVTSPLDRAVVADFAERVRAAGLGPVADLGCGPGHLTAYLEGLGLAAYGIDLSAEMVGIARRTYPGLRFEVGSITALPLPDGGLGGVLAWYSIVNTPPEHLPAVFAEFARVLAPGGHLLLGFPIGDRRRRLTEAFGRPVSIEYFQFPPARIAELLQAAGLTVAVRLEREPADATENASRATLIARRPGVIGDPSVA